MSRVLTDNWSLQNIGELFTSGLGDDAASVIDIAKDKSKHEYRPIDYGIIRIEALFDFLNDVVLKDEITVDDGYVDTWKGLHSPLEYLHNAGIIQPFSFLASPELLKGPRDALVERLCVTPSLKSEHSLNTSIWASDRKTPFPVLSSTLWGGAGMLARSHIYECNYTPHPLRRRLFLNAGVFMEKTDASGSLHALIQKKRVQLFGRNSNGDSLRTAFLQLPPIPFRIIEESNSLSDIFRIALEVRHHLKELRQWLGRFQNAIDTEDVTQILQHEELLDSVSRYADQVISGNSTGRVDMSVSLGVLKFSVKVDPVNATRNKFGVRSTINSLIFDKPGKQAIKKLLKLLGDEKTAAGYKVYQHFVSTAP